MDSFKSTFKPLTSLRPKMSAQVDVNTGHPSFNFTLDSMISSERDTKEIIQDVLSSLSKLEKGLIFAIDEFQKITEIDDGGVVRGYIENSYAAIAKCLFYLYRFQKKCDLRHAEQSI